MTFEEEFDRFIKKWTGNSYSHLCDSDENDGQRLRNYVKNNYTENQQLLETIKRVCLQTDEITEKRLKYLEKQVSTLLKWCEALTEENKEDE